MTIRDYLKKNNNELTSKLKKCLGFALFLPSSEVKLRALNDGLWFDVFLGFTLSVNDLAVLNSIFTGCWWCISPSADGSRFKFTVDLKCLNM